MTNTIPPMIRSAQGKRPAFYDNAAVDQIMSMVMVLTSEVSVLHDQIDLMQRAFNSKGIDLAETMKEVKLDQAALEEREARRQQLLARIFYVMRKEAEEAAAGETTEGYNTVIDEIAQP